MSADNYLYITKEKKEYKIYHLDMENNKLFWDGEDTFDNLEGAILAANEFMEENIVEFGLQVDI